MRHMPKYKQEIFRKLHELQSYENTVLKVRNDRWGWKNGLGSEDLHAGDASCKEPPCQCKRPKRCRFDPWFGKIPWRSKWQPTPVFLPEKSHGQKSLVGYSPKSCKDSDMTEWLDTNSSKHSMLDIQHKHTNIHTHTYTHTPLLLEIILVVNYKINMNLIGTGCKQPIKTWTLKSYEW